MFPKTIVVVWPIYLDDSFRTRDVYISLIEAIHDDLGLRIWENLEHVFQYSLICLWSVPIFILSNLILQFNYELLILDE